MNSGPVSDSISKAVSVEKIETTYSTETKSAPTSAPVEQTTFATTAPTRLPDGTTGATVGLIGKTTVTSDELKATYPCHTCPDAMKYACNQNGWRKTNDWKRIGNGECLTSGTIACIYNASIQSPKDLVGGTIPAGWLVDGYARPSGTFDYKFICQYDTRDGNPLTITAAPDTSASTAAAANTSAPTSYNDVKSGDWYYEAVMTLNQGGIIHTVFDTDPGGSFKPDAPVTDSEWNFIHYRLQGKETEDLIMAVTNRNKYRYQAIAGIVSDIRNKWQPSVKLTEQEKQLAAKTRTNAKGDIPDSSMPAPYYARWTKLMSSQTTDFYSTANQTTDAKTICQYADFFAKSGRWSTPYAKAYAIVEDNLRVAYDFGFLRTPNSPDTNSRLKYLIENSACCARSRHALRVVPSHAKMILNHLNEF